MFLIIIFILVLVHIIHQIEEKKKDLLFRLSLVIKLLYFYSIEHNLMAVKYRNMRRYKLVKILDCMHINYLSIGRKSSSLSDAVTSSSIFSFKFAFVSIVVNSFRIRLIAQMIVVMTS